MRARASRRTPLQQAVGLLQRREHSRRELARKLRARGVEGDEVEAALERLTDAGLQDDARFAQSVARQRCASGYGCLYIQAELKGHGLSDETIRQAIDLLEANWSGLARDLLSRRFPDGLPSSSEARRAATLLTRRGFPADAIRHALDSAR